MLPVRDLQKGFFMLHARYPAGLRIAICNARCMYALALERFRAFRNNATEIAVQRGSAIHHSYTAESHIGF